MIFFSMPLRNRYTRPSLNLYSLQAVIDTGASLPIIDLDDSYIQEYFGGIPLEYAGDISGIGYSSAKLYRLKEFVLGKMIFKDIIAFQAKINDANADILLGATMYGAGTKITIDSDINKITFEYPDEVANSHTLWNKDSKGVWRMIDYQNGHFVYL